MNILSLVKFIASLNTLHCILSTIYWWIKMNNNIILWTIMSQERCSKLFEALTKAKTVPELKITLEKIESIYRLSKVQSKLSRVFAWSWKNSLWWSIFSAFTIQVKKLLLLLFALHWILLFETVSQAAR